MIMKLTAIKQSELYKHINIDESKARQRGAVRSVEEEEANQEGDHERNQRPSITQRQDEKRACVLARACSKANLLFAPAEPRSAACCHVAPESIKSNHKSSDTQ